MVIVLDEKTWGVQVYIDLNRAGNNAPRQLYDIFILPIKQLPVKRILQNLADIKSQEFLWHLK
jgi:hypothetical protein